MKIKRNLLIYNFINCLFLILAVSFMVFSLNRTDIYIYILAAISAVLMLITYLLYTRYSKKHKDETDKVSMELQEFQDKSIDKKFKLALILFLTSSVLYIATIIITIAKLIPDYYIFVMGGIFILIIGIFSLSSYYLTKKKLKMRLNQLTKKDE